MNRRELLLDKAEALFSEHGFEGTSIRQLAKEANSNIAMISYYFGSKEKLFEALVEQRTASIRERLKDLHEQHEHPVVRLEELIRLYIDRFMLQPRFHRMLMHEVSLKLRPELQQAIADVLMRNVQELRRILQDGIDGGVFRQVDIDLTIVTLVGTISHLVMASPEIHARMFGVQSARPVEELPNLRERLYAHLHQLLMSHLLTNNRS
jgi:AcrR family transcriptional regulator